MTVAAKIILIYLGVMSLGFVVVILATWRQKHRNDRQAERYARLWESFRPSLEQVLFANREARDLCLPLQTRAFARYALAQLALYADRLTDDSLDRLARVLEALGHYNVIVRMSLSRKPSVRVEAMHWISTFRLFDFKAEALNGLEDRNALVQEKAFLAAVRIFSDRELERFLYWMDRTPGDFSQVDRMARALALLERVEDCTTASFVLGLYEQLHTPYAKRVLVEWVGHASITGAIPLLKEVLVEAGDSEVRIGAIRSIIRLHASSLLPDIINVCLNRDESDAVRIVAARALARLAEGTHVDRCLPVWMQLLGDNLWWVRTYAAAGIARLEHGRQVLERSAVEHPDSFAREMSAYFAQILEDQGALWKSIERSLATG